MPPSTTNTLTTIQMGTLSFWVSPGFLSYVNTTSGGYDSNMALGYIPSTTIGNYATTPTVLVPPPVPVNFPVPTVPIPAPSHHVPQPTSATTNYGNSFGFGNRLGYPMIADSAAGMKS